LAHVINLAAQQILITLKATAANNENELLNGNNTQLSGSTGELLHKLTDFLFNINIINFIKFYIIFSFVH
jgi:hypothetical protein